MSFKKCTKCGVLTDSFHVDRSKGDGRSCWCKNCRNKAQASIPKEIKKVIDKRHRDRNQTALLIKKRLEYIANKPRYRAANKRWYLANLNKVKVDSTKWRSENKESVREAAKKYYLENKQKIKNKVKLWRKSNPAKKYAHDLNRRAVKLKNGGRVTGKQLTDRVNFWGNRCWICSGLYECDDHVIPLSKGGTNWPSNIRPACKSCNSKKHAQDWRKWVTQYRLPIISKLP